MACFDRAPNRIEILALVILGAVSGALLHAQRAIRAAITDRVEGLTLQPCNSNQAMHVADLRAGSC